MTVFDTFLITSIILAIAVNSFAIYLQRKYQIYNRYFGKQALVAHGVVITLFWGVVIVACSQLYKSDWLLPQTFPLLGIGIIIFAVCMFILAYIQIGSGGLCNANFFGKPTKKLTGIYKYVPEPMYVSYSLLFLGLGLRTGQIGFLAAGAVTFVGLMAVEARVEQV